MPKINLGRVLGAGGGGDWLQHDPGAENYIKNRPCYNNREVITWDGDTTGLETFTATAVSTEDGQVSQLAFYRISERTPAAYDFDGNPLSVVTGPSNIDLSIEAFSAGVFRESNGGILYCDFVLFEILIAKRTGDFHIKPEDTMNGENDVTGTIPATGFYVYGSGGMKRFSATVGQLKKLDPALLPEGISGRHVVDIGSGELDMSTLDFSNYAAGDEILIVGNMTSSSNEGGGT